MAVFRNMIPVSPNVFYLPDFPGQPVLDWYIADFYSSVEEVQRRALKDADWQPLPVAATSIMEIAVATQAPLLYLFPEKSQSQQVVTHRAWVRTVDLQYAQRYPVLLIHLSSSLKIPQIALSGEIMIGTHALIAKDDQTCLYHLDQLGEQGQHLYEIIQTGLSSKVFQQRSDFPEQSLSPVDILAHQRWMESRAPVWQQALQAMRQLARLYWELHQKITPTSTMRTLPTTPDVFVNGLASIIPNTLMIQSVLSAYSNAQSGGAQWKLVEQQPIYQFQQAKDMALVEFRPSPTEVTPLEVTLQSLSEQISQFNDHDGDVFLILLAQWMIAPQDDEGYVWITTDQILNYRGIRKQNETQDHRVEDLQRVAESFVRIRDTHITLHQWTEEQPTEQRRGRRKKKIVEQQSYIVSIAEFRQQREVKLENTPSAPSNTTAALPIAWKYKLARCLAFLEGPNKPVAWILQQALRYDPYHEYWEKRLARYFTFKLRMNRECGGTTISRPIGEMLDELSLPQNRGDPDKTRKRFEKAMQRLQDDQVISAWGYQEDLAQLPPHKWLDIWLGYHVQVTAEPLLERKKRGRPATKKEHDA